MKTILLLILLLPTSAMSSDLVGLWAWDNNSDKQAFSLMVGATDSNTYSATYCAVAMSGSRIDCSPNQENVFKFVLNEPFTFKTHYSGNLGTAKISLSNGKLIWEIIKKPNGEHYAPANAMLSKQQKDT